MKLLIDESVSAVVARLLVQAGHDAVHLGDLGRLGVRDEIVMATAVEAQRTLVSADNDLGELLAIGRHPGPSVVLLRHAPHRPESQAWLLLRALPPLAEDLAVGAIAVITPSRIRVRRLPIVRGPGGPAPQKRFIVPRGVNGARQPPVLELGDALRLATATSGG